MLSHFSHVPLFATLWIIAHQAPLSKGFSRQEYWLTLILVEVLAFLVVYYIPRSNCVLEKTLESPLDSKEFQPVNPKGNQSWIFIGRIDDEAEAPILWPLDEKSWLIGKDPDAGKVWRQEKGITENEMVGWHHWLNVQESEQTLGDSEGQGSLACSVHGVAKSQTWLIEQQQQYTDSQQDLG